MIIFGDAVAVFSLFQKKNPVCGLDLGTDWMKVVRVAPEGRKVRLTSMGRMVRPLDGKDQAETVSGALRVMLNRLGLKDRVVVSSMAGHDVIIKRVSLHPPSDKGLDAAIRKEARQYIPFDVSDVYLDYQVVGQGGAEEALDVLLVASKKKVVHGLEQTLDRAGISLSVVDVDAFALNNCFEFNYPELLEEPVYLLDIGAQQSIFSVYWQAHPFFLREVPFGGRNLTQDLARSLNVSRVEAEKLKVAGDAGETGKDRDGARRQVRATVLNWVEELRRLIGFYQSLVPDARLANRLLLSGGGSLVTGLEDVLAEELGLTVEYLDPWRNILVDDNQFDRHYLKQTGPQFAVAAGLALRELVHSGKRS
ncbi:MAG TPA: type IV pilus assembly protein PilM [Desulfomicrobiaceae bacterium]|nr:type IV pilus assembly protein PilM [Desulfomicrobiaceae bacterium]